MDIFNLVGKLILDVSDYKKKLDEAKKKSQEFADHTDKKVKTKSVLAWTAILTAVVALSKSIIKLTIDTMNYADNIGDLADKYGFTTRQIQEFEYWASLNGTTLEGMLSAMTRLTNQAQVNADAFKRLGVAVKDENGNLKSQKQLFVEVATALNNVENATERNALQFDIFGRSGNEIAQVLKQGGEELNRLSDEAERYGIILSEKTIKSASDFNDQLAILKMRGRSVFAELIAGAEGAEEKFDEFTSDIIDKVEQLIPQFFDLGEKLAQALVRGLIKYVVDKGWSMIKGMFGEGWLWGEKNDWVESGKDFFGGLFGANSMVSSSMVNERTTKTEETLEVTMRVESDGTVASEQNLDVMSDLIVERINKAMGDMING